MTRLFGLSVMAAMIAALLALAGGAGAAPSGKDDEGAGGEAAGSEQGVGILAEQEISSAGPITRINVDDNLQNDVDYNNVEQTFPDESATHLKVGDDVFGERGFSDFTPVDQTLTGSGTDQDPFEIVTTVAAGDTGLTLTQTDTYVEGERSYLTNIEVENNGATDARVILYRYVDCEVGVPEQEDNVGGVDDGGFGAQYPETGAAACIEAIGTLDQDGNFTGEPGNNLLGLRPLSKGSDFQEGERRSESGTDGVIEKVEDGKPFDKTVDENYVDDNVVGLNWDIIVPAGGSVTLSSLMGFKEEELTRGPGCTVLGSNGDNNLVGTAARDVICGMGGNDTIDGGGGNDLLKGGSGRDTIRDDEGEDTLRGGKNDDTLNAKDGAGGDELVGRKGTDTCRRDQNDIATEC